MKRKLFQIKWLQVITVKPVPNKEKESIIY